MRLELYDRIGSAAFSLGVRVTNDREAAEEAVATAFAAVPDDERTPASDDGGADATHVLLAVRREAFDRRRGKANARDPVSTDLPVPATGDIDPTLTADYRNRLRLALDALTLDSSHDVRIRQAALFALGGLDGSERIDFEEHLDACRACIDEVRSLLPVTQALAFMAPPQSPPTHLRDRIIDLSAPASEDGMGLLTLPIRRPVAVTMFFLGIMLVERWLGSACRSTCSPRWPATACSSTSSGPGASRKSSSARSSCPCRPGSPLWRRCRRAGGRFEAPLGTCGCSSSLAATSRCASSSYSESRPRYSAKQPRGTVVSVTKFDTSILASIAMMVHVVGGEGDDRNALFDLAQELVAPRFASVSGVSQALTGGGGGRQVTVTVDPDRSAALGVTTEAVSQAVADNVGHLRFLGQLESATGRVPVILDGRPAGLTSLGEARIQPDRPVRLRHVSELRYGPGT